METGKYTPEDTKPVVQTWRQAITAVNDRLNSTNRAIDAVNARLDDEIQMKFDALSARIDKNKFWITKYGFNTTENAFNAVHAPDGTVRDGDAPSLQPNSTIDEVSFHSADDGVTWTGRIESWYADNRGYTHDCRRVTTRRVSVSENNTRYRRVFHGRRKYDNHTTQYPGA